MQLTTSDALSRTSLLDSLAPLAVAPGSTVATESFRGALYEPCVAGPSPRGQNPSDDVVGGQSEPNSSASEDAESTEDSPAADQREAAIAAAAIIVPAVAQKELPQVAQAVEGTEEVAPSDAAAADGRTVQLITVAGANTNQLPAAALTDSSASPDEQPPGLAGGQAARTFRDLVTIASDHANDAGELTGKRETIVTRGTIGDELSTANERGEESRETAASVQHVIEIPMGATDGLESFGTEAENSHPADAATPIAQSGESGAWPAQNSAATSLQSMSARLPPDLLAATSGRPMPESQASEADSIRLIQRVARAFAATQDGSGEVRLRLSPPELGALRLEVKVEGGAVIARIEAETSAARTALIENLPALRERLAEQGVRIERFDVDLMKRGDEHAFDRPADQPRQDHAAQPHLQPRERRLPQVAEGVVARTTILGDHLFGDHDQRRLNVLV